jgi:hypothetical protein
MNEGTENEIRVLVSSRGDMATLTVSPPKDPTGNTLRRAGLFVGAMALCGWEVILRPDRQPF